MKKDTNVFILTTEYHFLLAIHIIEQQYSVSRWQNILVFTGKRLSMVKPETLPSNIKTITIDIESERHLKRFVHEEILTPFCANVFVFTAYRDLETYVLCSANRSIIRHLVQDGANFYYNITESVWFSRLKETLKIYRNLFRRGIFLNRFVLYKKHLAHCAFIDEVWLTNPDIYQAQEGVAKKINRIALLGTSLTVDQCSSYFGLQDSHRDAGEILYLSSRLTVSDEIENEVNMITLLANLLPGLTIVVKGHPNATMLQQTQLREAFNDRVLINCIPAELYIAKSSYRYVIGVASAGLFYNNQKSRYFSLLNYYKKHHLFSNNVEVLFPPHVYQSDDVNEIAELIANEEERF